MEESPISTPQDEEPWGGASPIGLDWGNPPLPGGWGPEDQDDSFLDFSASDGPTYIDMQLTDALWAIAIRQTWESNVELH
ncbi:hypothetical protein OPQ81_002709 [Rhizoctonia solani]|nr:hypothetical protein OPQ81_002709 [Rhizoctonia solani]